MPDLDDDDLREICQEELHHLRQESVKRRSWDDEMSVVQVVRERRGGRKVAGDVSWAELEVKGANVEHRSNRVLLSDGEGGDDVGLDVPVSSRL